jgi:hypothetical protein
MGSGVFRWRVRPHARRAEPWFPSARYEVPMVVGKLMPAVIED